MALTDQLLEVSARFCHARNLSKARVSTLVFNDGKKLDFIEQGKDLSTKNHERAMQWFSDHWPPDAVWPEAVERPPPAKAETAA